MTAELDAELNLGPLHLAIGTLSDEVKDLRKRLTTIQDDLNPTATLTYSADTAQNFCDLGGPSSGKWWQIRYLIVGGSDITSTPAGVAWIVVTSSSMMQANPPLFAVRDFTTATFPQRAFYGTHELIVLDDQHLFVFFTGGTNGTQYSASAMVESFPQFVKGRL